MADLAKTQAQWNQIMKRMGFWIGEWFRYEDEERRLRKARTQTRKHRDQSEFLTAINLVGTKVGENTAENGRIWGTLTDEAPVGGARISLYSDSGRSALVAQGSGANGTTLSLVAQNSSGLSGTIAIGTVSASDQDIILEAVPDLRRRAATLFTLDDDMDHVRDVYDAIERRRTQINSLKTAWKSAFDTGFLLKRLKKFLGSSRTAASTATESASSGVITAAFGGVIADLIDAMRDEVTGGRQFFQSNTTAATGPTKDADNTGSGTFTGMSMGDGIRPGTLFFECTDATIGSEQFTVTQKPDDSDTIITAGNALQIKKSWLSVNIGMAVTLNRIISTSGATTIAIASPTFSGETSTNFPNGIDYWTLKRSGSTFTIRLFTASTELSNTSSLKVAEGSQTGSAGYNGTIAFTETNNSGLSGSCTISGYSSDDADVSNAFNLHVFALNDRFRSTITNTESGRFATFISRQYNQDLVNVVSGTETISDYYAQAFPRIGGD